VTRYTVNALSVQGRKQVGMMWIGFMWLRTRTSSGFLWTQQWTFSVHKTQGISWLPERL